MSRMIQALGILMVLGGVAWAADGVVYNRYNIHAGTDAKGTTLKASYANYTDPGPGHFVVKMNTPIRIGGVSSKGFTVSLDDGKVIQFEYHEPRMGMPVADYIKKITADAPVPVDGLSALDKQGVEQGKALVGMSREGVMAALGYPAAHKTPSLTAATFVYWTNRFATLAVDFDADGKVTAVRH